MQSYGFDFSPNGKHVRIPHRPNHVREDIRNYAFDIFWSHSNVTVELESFSVH